MMLAGSAGREGAAVAVVVGAAAVVVGAGTPVQLAGELWREGGPM